MPTAPSELAELARLAVHETLATIRPLNAERLAYSLAEAADVIGIPKRTLQDAQSRGEFKATKRCGRWMVTRAELLRWLTD